MAFRYSLQS